MSFRDDWPTNGDGTEYDGKNLLDLVRKDQSPFRGVWDVNQLIAEVEEKLNSKVLDILNVHKGSNNYGLHFVLSDRPAVLVRLARGDVNMPHFDGFPVDVQVSEMRFEATVYELLRERPEIKASRLLYHRVPVKYATSSSTPPKDLAGRRLMVFQRAEGEINVWRQLNPRQKSSLLTQAAEIRAALFKFDLPLDLATAWFRERLFEQKPDILPIPVAPTREFCIALFTSKIEATIKTEGDMIGWPDDNAVVGPRAAAAKQSILRLIPHILPEEPGDEQLLYRLVLEHGDFGIHNMSIVHSDEEDVEITSLFDWETGCIVPALLSDTEMALPVDLALDGDGEPAVARIEEDALTEEVGEWMGWSCHYHQQLFARAPEYEAVIRAGRDARYLWFALKAWRGEYPEGYFGRLGEWAEDRINALSRNWSLSDVV